jgi:serine/threonine protein kinase
MAYCFNPHCPDPEHPGDGATCRHSRCQARLRLRGRYEGVRKLATGGFGNTYLALDLDRLRSYCVVKQLHLADAKALDLFRREARSLLQLGEHKQLPQPYAEFEEDGHQYLVQKYIEGQTLHGFVKQRGAFDGEGVRHFLESLLPVVGFLHRNGVIHRDIKPLNVMLDAYGQYILIDLGAVKLVAHSPVVGGTLVSSGPYTAPEQLTGQAHYGSDIYSLGITALYLLMGRDPEDFLMREGWWQYELRQKGGTPSLERILTRMIQRECPPRYSTVDEVLHDLNRSAFPLEMPHTSYIIPTHRYAPSPAPVRQQSGFWYHVRRFG